MATAARPLAQEFWFAGLVDITTERPLKTRDSARDLGALARVLSASRFGGMLRVEAHIGICLTTRGVTPMAKTPSNHGKEWSAADVKKLRQLAKQSVSTRATAAKLGRTLASVAQKASVEAISFKSKRQRPNGRRKK